MAATTTSVADLIADLDAFVEEAVRTIAVEVTANLQEATPVDTGFARASWVPSLGMPSSPAGGTEDAPNPAAATQGLADVAGYRLSDGKAFVSNVARYIQRLNAGHSKQAPAGFVRACVERGVTTAVGLLDDSLSRLRRRRTGAGG